MNTISETILSIIRNTAAEYCRRASVEVRFREPLCGFSDAQAPGIRNLPSLIPGHILPTDALPGATAVLSYFLPFAPEVEASNRDGRLSSEYWAQSYEETNALFPIINERIIRQVEAWGYEAVVPPEASAFDREKLISRWSQRHLANQAGLGTFGLHNLLITESGCCGRLSSVVTTLPHEMLEIGHAPEEERCLYKKNGTCAVCVKRCPTGALTCTGYDRHKCFEICMENAAIYNCFGNSYADTAGGEAADSGSEVCGKCCTGVPCAFRG